MPRIGGSRPARRAQHRTRGRLCHRACQHRHRRSGSPRGAGGRGGAEPGGRRRAGVDGLRGRRPCATRGYAPPVRRVGRPRSLRERDTHRAPGRDLGRRGTRRVRPRRLAPGAGAARSPGAAVNVSVAGVVAGELVGVAVSALPSPGTRAAARMVQALGRPPDGRGDAARVEVADLAEHLAGAFRAGLPPTRAWRLLAEQAGPAAGGAGTVAAVAAQVAPRVGLGMPSGRALWEAAPASARPRLVALAAALDLCERSGAPTAAVLDGLGVALRAGGAAGPDGQIALAAPRATTTVMSLLPLAGVGLGALLGVDTAAVLLRTPAGRLCLVLAAVLWALGRWWTRRLVRAAVRGEEDDP